MNKPRQRQQTGVHHDPCRLTRLHVAPPTELTFIANLRLAGSGDADAKRRMQHALQTALVRDRR